MLLFLGGAALVGTGWAMIVHAQDWPVRTIGEQHEKHQRHRRPDGET